MLINGKTLIFEIPLLDQNYQISTTDGVQSLKKHQGFRENASCNNSPVLTCSHVVAHYFNESSSCRNVSDHVTNANKY